MIKTEDREPTPEDLKRVAVTERLTRDVHNLFDEMKKDDPIIQGFYVLGILATSDVTDEEKIETHVFEFGDNMPADVISAELHNRMHEWMGKAELEKTYGMMGRIMEHTEPEMRALQMIYEKIADEIGGGKPTKNMMIIAIKNAPPFLVGKQKFEQLTKYIERFEYISEEEAVDRILSNLKMEIHGDTEEHQLPKEVLMIAAQAAAQKTKKLMCLDTPIEALTQKFMIALDPDMEKLR